MIPISLQSTITCPFCNHAKTEILPIETCQFFYDCTNCGRVLRPKQGDCCVFCSYGSRPCPSVQKAQKVETSNQINNNKI
ncbi:MAG: hypothetical protein COV66_15545 [Nitrospinae bacterium CG11_big_fil_rev_8_21_14_0_20_45_15]|nr:MAG: hypothetical protein COV66_15545 [Nitrospinae bacterium CG11_big_fil_rev_8_21_14_0_20_45_15]